MYTPKISEDLIPTLYKLSKARKRPMTKVVNEIITDYLQNIEIIEEKTIIQEIKDVPKKLYKIVERTR
jgi:hypothetical protein